MNRQELLDEFQPLFHDVDQEWESFKNDNEFCTYVSADFEAVLDALIELRQQAHTCLEWGSGMGVAAIMASRLGFESYGIEVNPRLVELSREFADEYEVDVEFAQGNFIPDEYEWTPDKGDFGERMLFSDPAAYDQLDMELRDFDIVYAYPWPEEHALYRSIVCECGSNHSVLLTYDIYEGIQVTRFND